MARSAPGGVGVLLVILAGCAGITQPPRAGASTPGAAATGSVAGPADPAAPQEAAPGTNGEAAEPGDADEPDDGLELPPEDAAGAALPASPLAAMTDAQIQEKLVSDPAALGPMSIGAASGGLLYNGVQMPEGDGWTLIDRAHAWGTQETVDSLIRAIGEVQRRFPGSPKLAIGHISARTGGRLSPHVSHQSGRDVDISYYLDGGRPGFRRASATNLDRERTWAFVRALITETDVELILIDTGVQRLLKDHAVKAGEDTAWLNEVFQIGSKHARPLIRHAKGHANHLHIRFYNPIAQASAARVVPVLRKLGKMPAPAHYLRHTVKSGQTLGILARRYGTTVQAIQRANGMRSTHLKVRQVINIPRAGAQPVASPPAAPRIPPRRRPPVAPAAPAAEGAHGPVLDG